MPVEVNDELLNRLCSLAKLNISPEQRLTAKQDLMKILGMIERLNELDTSKVEPLVHITQEHNHLRLDIPESSLAVSDILQNAPKKDTDYIRVPKVVDK
ncbi:MAG: Asp-tRNA(Asn)/Glu-tRNA(Gln) amidotransferase subunit GatC [Bacteroidia bacterium]|nr:Asp-tRNA(Asn)/Glu-tRNA(Gln) amidotransferase subunit GatC [Bacteroidia bacterium]